MRTEDELINALREGARRAPGADLLAGVARRRQRRTRRRAQFLAAAAVVAVTGTGAVVVQTYAIGRGEEPRPATTSTVTMPTTAKPWNFDEVPVAELWPQAVFTMPATNADGWRYRPVTALGATEVLLAAETPDAQTGAFEIYNSVTGQARKIVDVPRDAGMKVYVARRVTVSGSDLAWFAHGEKADGATVHDVWTAPLAGGEARLLASRTGQDADLDAIAIHGDHVLWSETDGGVWRVPLAGGDPERIPGTDGLHLIGGPWASDVPDGPQGNQTRLVNLAENHTIAVAAPPGVTHWRCGPSWCHGRKGSGTVIYRADGTAARTVLPTKVGPFKPYPILDRFIPVGRGVYDVTADKLAGLSNPGPWTAMGNSSEPTTIFYWGATKTESPDEPATYQLLNLAAVPPAQ